MSHSIHHFNRFFRRALSLLASGLLVGGLVSCSGSNNNSTSNGVSQLTLTLSPASISLTAGAAGAAGFPAPGRTGGRWCGYGGRVWTANRSHGFPGYAVTYAGR